MAAEDVANLTVSILREIRDEVRKTNQRLDQPNERLDQTNERLERLEKRQTETEVRLATELVAVASAVGELTELLRQDRALRQRVDDHERRISYVGLRVGIVLHGAATRGRPREAHLRDRTEGRLRLAARLTPRSETPRRTSCRGPGCLAEGPPQSPGGRSLRHASESRADRHACTAPLGCNDPNTCWNACRQVSRSSARVALARAGGRAHGGRTYGTRDSTGPADARPGERHGPQSAPCRSCSLMPIRPAGGSSPVRPPSTSRSKDPPRHRCHRRHR